MHLALYQAATGLAARTIHRGKLGAGLTGRREAAQRWERWAVEYRGSGRLIWLHAASVGEALAAEPVVRRLRAAAALQIVRTCSSPSALQWPGPDMADASDYLPLDTRPAVRLTLDALRPTALVFSRGDLWPVLVSEAERRGIPVVVIGGLVRPTSRRLAWPTRTLLQPLHKDLSAVGAVSAADGDRWRTLGVRAETIQITGDPRHDWVLERPTVLAPIRDVLAWRRDGRGVLVAGSVEPEDEGPLLEAMEILKSTGSAPRIVLVPHEASHEAVRQLVERLAARGILATTWPGGPIGAGMDCVVVTARGVLADLYVAADIAYVGGGFGRRGTHNSVEPAAYGVPVILGARGAPGQDERELLMTGGGVSLELQGAGVRLAQTCQGWLANGAVRGRTAGIAARRMLATGAASRSADLIRRAAGLD